MSTESDTGRRLSRRAATWDIEDAPTGLGHWYETGLHLFDTFNVLHGHINFLRVLGNSGVVSGISVAGGSNVGLGDLTKPGGLDLARGSGGDPGAAGLEDIPGLLERFPDLADLQYDVPPDIPPLTARQYLKRAAIQARV